MMSVERKSAGCARGAHFVRTPPGPDHNCSRNTAEYNKASFIPNHHLLLLSIPSFTDLKARMDVTMNGLHPKLNDDEVRVIVQGPGDVEWRCVVATGAKR